MSKWCYVLSETDSCLWSEGRESGSSGPGSCLSTLAWRKATVPGAATRNSALRAQATERSEHEVSARRLHTHTHTVLLLKTCPVSIPEKFQTKLEKGGIRGMVSGYTPLSRNP